MIQCGAVASVLRWRALLVRCVVRFRLAGLHDIACAASGARRMDNNDDGRGGLALEYPSFLNSRLEEARSVRLPPRAKHVVSGGCVHACCYSHSEPNRTYIRRGV